MIDRIKKTKYLYKDPKTEELLDKINELVDQVNSLTRAHTPAKVKGIDKQCLVCGGFLPCECGCGCGK